MDAFSSNDPLQPGPLPYANITNPLSLNKYTYTYNNPLRYTDQNGHFPTGIHEQIIDTAFPGLSSDQRQILKDASLQVDTDQSTDGASRHGMRAPDQSVDDARNEFNDFVDGSVKSAKEAQSQFQEGGGSGLSDDALEAAGGGIHAVTDSQSPTHEGFQVWSGLGVGNLGSAAAHAAGESNPTQAQINRGVNQARGLFRRAFGNQAADAAITEPKKEED